MEVEDRVFLVPIILFTEENAVLRFGENKFCAIMAESKLDVLRLTKNPSFYANRKKLDYFEFDKRAKVVETSIDRHPTATSEGTILSENYLETMASLREAA